MKYRNLLNVVSVVFCFTLLPMLSNAENFKLLETWDHGEKIFGEVKMSMVDKEGNLLVGFYRNGLQLITPKEIIHFAPFGEGPNEVRDFWTFVPYKGDIGILTACDKMKVFTKKDNTYVWKDTLWFKRGRLTHFVTGTVFADNKWFFSGDCSLTYGTLPKEMCLLKVYGEDRKALKLLLKKKANKWKYKHHLMNFYIDKHNDKVYFIPENRFLLSIISVKDLSVEKTVHLDVPSFYKKMPEDFYSYEGGLGSKITLYIEKWQTSYSRISKFLIRDNQLIIQIRTCDEKLKKFCLLFYDIDTLKLKKQVLMDDFLLGAREGKFYFYAGGNPSYDEIDNCVIKIYRFEDSE